MIERIYYRVKLNTDQIIYAQRIDILEAKLNENIIKDPSKTYLVWKGNQFPNSTNATFKAPEGCTIDWGDGTVETFETASTEVNTHTYTDGFEYHLISLSNYTVIDNSAFYNCSGLTSVTIGNGVTSIGDNAFSGCDGLTSVTIGNGVTSIGDNAFFGCSGLTSITIPNSVTSTGYQAFHNCSSLTSVTIPDSVTTISYAAFSGCSGLTSVTIGNSVRNIGSSAFDGCSGLTSVTIPDSVTFMGDYAFDGCSGLKTVRISATTPPTLGSNAFETSLEKIIVPKSAINAYKTAEGWSTYADKIVYEVDSSDLDAVVINLENGTDSVLIQTTDTNHSFKVMTDGRAKVQTAPKDNDDVTRKGDFKTINGNSIIGSGDLTIAGSDDKLDKITTAGDDRVYGVDALGNQTVYRVSVSEISGTIVTRDYRGNIYTANGTSGTHAVNFSQLDKKYDKSGGEISGDVTIKGKTKVQTAPEDDDDVVRKLELDRKFDKAGGTVTGDMIVSGNLTVQGKTTTVDSENLRVADKLIEVGKGNTAPLTSPAGLITPKYDGTNNGGIVYDHTGTAYVGDITLDSNGNVDVNNSDLQPIATRNDTIANGNLVKWDGTNHKLVDSGKNVDSFVDKSYADNLNARYVSTSILGG